MTMMKKLLSTWVLLIGTGAAALAYSQVANAATFSVTITVDENGNGTFTNTTGFNAALSSALVNDPGPGGLNSVLTYDLKNPPGLVAGDVALTDAECGGCTFDVIRFNSGQVGPGGGTGTLVFYSDNIDGLDSIGDTSGPPGGYYANLLSIPELGPEGSNGVIYTPTAGQPGFVAGAAGPVTYDIISDGIAATPLPSTWTMLIAGFFGLGFFASRGMKRQAAGAAI
jgi:hypothetical protein